MSTPDLSKYQVAILCGGQGTRIRAVAEDRPKPMVDVGGRPILWHIMKIYSHYGFRRFILCLGHQGEKIVEFFENYKAYNHDFTMQVNDPSARHSYADQLKSSDSDVDDWEITFAHTGVDTMTGGRLRRISRYIDQDHFFATYGDGVSDVDIPSVFQHHVQAKNVATMVGVHLPTTFGIVEVDATGKIETFREKPVLPGYINGGFFCFTPEIFDQIEGDSTVLENQPFRALVDKRKIGMVPHAGFWHAMDHYKDYTTLNDLWKQGTAPWKVW
jgi:glucose-1-phosphate cytidylyltransferase